MPKKIDAIRARNQNITQQEEERIRKDKAKDLNEKIGPKVEKWIEEKLFCYLNKHLNTNFQVWLNSLRIEESKTILTNGKKVSIEEVGIMVGIPQSYNFSRWFKAITDMTPYQYRKQNTNN